jgi:prolyl-tRNA synthetase
MPALTPKENWETTKRWNDFDVLFKLKGAGKKDYALGATHEEVVVPLAKKYVSSYKDLPFSVYQIQTKFRNELRAKAGLLRGREFSMKDLYSFHENKEDLDRYYEIVKDAYFNVYKRCGLGDLTYLTFAGGGTFSKYSHEFQTLAENGEDYIHICSDCNIAINEELIEDQEGCCPQCGKKDLKKEKSIEVGNIFKLRTKYSSPFELKYADKEGNQKEVEMGCYGIGPSRIMGSIVEIFNDDKGIIWPEEVAPYQVHLIALFDDEGKIKSNAEQLYKDLENKGVEVFYDDRLKSPGEKFAEADLIGIPNRLVISEKTLNEDSVEIKKRDSGKAELIGLNKAGEVVS